MAAKTTKTGNTPTRGAFILTGASDGIGKGMALALARRGTRLGLVARRRELLESVAQQCRALGAPQVEILVADVCHSEGFRVGLGDLEQSLGFVEGFIANAGINFDIPTCVDGAEKARQVIDVNLTAAIAGLEFFKARWVSRRRGLLVGVSSVAGARGLPHSGVYSATKAGLTAYLESLRLDLRSYGLQVIDIAPGFIDTALTRRNTNPKPFMIDAQQAGELFIRGVLRGKTRIIGPWPFFPMYVILRILPHALYQWFGALLGKMKPED